jgi:hypothetical protein
MRDKHSKSEQMIETMDSSNQDVRSVFVEQEKLSPDIQSYIKALAKQFPFTKDSVIDSRQTKLELSKFWPKLSEWTAEASELLDEIEDIVCAAPTVKVNPNIMLRIAVASSTLSPVALPEPDESAVIATFNAAEGILRRYIVPASDEAQVSEDMGIPFGLIVICQPLLPLINPIGDNRKRGLGAGNIYSERVRDVMAAGNDVDEDRPIASSEVHELVQHTVHQTPHTSGLGEAAGEAIAAEAVEKFEEVRHAAMPHYEEKKEEDGKEQHENGKLALAEAEEERTQEVTEEAAEKRHLEEMSRERIEAAEAESEQTAEISELAIEAAVVETELMATEEEKGIIPELPERPESAAEFAAEAASEAEAVEERNETLRESPFAPPEKALEAAAELRDELNAEDTNELMQEVARTETGPEGASAAQAANETRAQEAEVGPSLESAAEPQGVEAAEREEAPSAVEQNGETQEQTEGAQSESEPQESGGSAENGQEAPSESENSANDMKEQYDKMKEQFGDTEPHQESHEAHHTEYHDAHHTESGEGRYQTGHEGQHVDTHRSHSSIEDSGFHAHGDRYSSTNNHIRRAFMERPFHHTMDVGTASGIGSLHKSSFVTQRFPLKGGRSMTKAYENGYKYFGPIMAAERGRTMMALHQIQRRPVAGFLQRKSIKKMARKIKSEAKSAAKHNPDPTEELEKLTPKL